MLLILSIRPTMPYGEENIFEGACLTGFGFHASKGLLGRRVAFTRLWCMDLLVAPR